MNRYSEQKLVLFDNHEHNIYQFKQVIRELKVASLGVSETYALNHNNINILSEADVIFVHWRSDSREALSLCQSLRYSRNSPNPFLPIIIMSDAPTRRNVEAARDAGVDEFLARPYSVRTVEEHLRSVVENRRGFVKVEGFFGPDRRRGAMAKMLGQERRSTPSELIDPKSDVRTAE